MKLTSHAKVAINNLRYSLLRTILAVVGITVGTAAVVALMSSGKLATEAALEQFKKLGTQLMTINFNPQDFMEKTGIGPSFIESMPKSIPDIEVVAPFITMSTTAEFKTLSINATFIGATDTLQDLINLKIQRGRFISRLDKMQPFCVVGEGIFKQLRTLTPLGQSILVQNNLLTIVGVADKWTENNFFPADVNNSILLPIEAFPQFFPQSNLNSAIMKLTKEANIDKVKEEITQYFHQTYPTMNLNFRSAKEILKQMAAQQDIFSLLLGFIGGISLFVGGIGVMNIMLASVSERRYEIGLRMALGAEPKDIRWMFLMESAFLAAIGGSLGVLLGILGTWITAEVSNWPFILFFSPALIGFSASILVSIFFGFYPAYLASKLNPIEALRAN